jgi:DNA-binding XRE family transcriptional regulator
VSAAQPAGQHGPHDAAGEGRLRPATIVEAGMSDVGWERAAMAEGRAAPFGEQLRRLREAAGITQEELAERAGLSRDAVGALERGLRRSSRTRTGRCCARRCPSVSLA